jgi:UDP-3-O-[3-hydroxymyristoyl] glucosamine N-acyltransferase
VHRSARIAKGAVVEAGARVGARAVVGPNAVVSAGATIGEDSVVGPCAVVGPDASVGRRVRIGAGAVVGSDGFGYVSVGGELRRIPHVGRVVVEDDVDIGANACIARATLGTTRIAAGTRIDALVQIGHNVFVGEGSVLAAQVGLAGSVRLGRGVTVGGQAGVADHLEIGDGARLAAKAGVIGDVPPGATVAGYPARPRSKWLREHATLARLAAGKKGRR